MPIKYVCSNCGYVLSIFEKVGQDYYGVPTPEEVIRVLGVCPRCKNELSIPTINNIKIIPLKKPIILSMVKEMISREEASDLLMVKKGSLETAQEI